MFQVLKDSPGRIGLLEINGRTVHTPILLPVMYFLSGTTPNSGGSWKYTRNLVLERKIPVLSQVMHFMDYDMSRSALERWRSKPIREWYRDFEYDELIFLDSGGFQLMTRNSFTNPRGWSIEPTPENILSLQMDLGGDAIATLDYPILPGMSPSEARERARRSIDNAVRTLELVRDQVIPSTGTSGIQVFVSVHGTDYEMASWYVKSFFKKLQSHEGLDEIPIGLAIGSLVPMKARWQYLSIADVLRGVQEAIPEERRRAIPLHVFGVTGDMMPLLIYLGVDSFDSSTYVQMSKNVRYIHPDTWKSLDVNSFRGVKPPCDCDVCRTLDIGKMLTVLNSPITHKPINGHYKSEYYAKIAMHNLNVYLNEMERVRVAISAGNLQEHLIEFATLRKNLAEALTYLSQWDSELKVSLSQSQTAVGADIHSIPKPDLVSLKFTSEDFTLPTDYTPPSGKRILLLLPCSKKKPYRASRSHLAVMKRLVGAFSTDTVEQEIHKVTISGLYGPVPEEFEDLPAVREYEFYLSSGDLEAKSLVERRLMEFLEKFRDHYEFIVAYVATRAYREVVRTMASKLSDIAIHVLPTHVRIRDGREFRKTENLNQLVKSVRLLLEHD
jgi:7-cyano-7-deazaguanine tRNA-ribosyltransferase